MAGPTKGGLSTALNLKAVCIYVSSIATCCGYLGQCVGQHKLLTSNGLSSPYALGHIFPPLFSVLLASCLRLPAALCCNMTVIRSNGSLLLPGPQPHAGTHASNRAVTCLALESVLLDGPKLP
eukprot:scaffold165711_cov23-Prasinocladus_malaysianus.AAC.1